jgi:type IV pilus assembly protein PilE
MDVTDSRKKGFTLVELVVALFIVALLLTLTLPSYQRQLRNTRRSLGGAELLQVMMKQEQYFLDRKRYAATLTDLGLPANPYAIDAQGNAVSAQASDRIYLIELTLQQNAYTLRATPQLSQAADRLCSTLSLDSTGVKRVAGSGATRACW